MPRYYTGTTFSGKGWGKPDYPYKDSPAVLFFDSEGSVSFEDALEGVRAYLADDGEASTPMLYRPLQRPGGRTEWVFTPSMHLPKAGSCAAPVGTTLIANIFAPKLEEMPVDTVKIYEGCLQLQRLMSRTDCPCELATADSWKVSKCEEHVLYPELNIVPVAELMRRKFSQEKFLPPTGSPTIAGFTYISPTTLATGEGLQKRAQFIDNLRTDEAFIQASRGEASDRAQAAAKTRKLKKAKCTGCIFEREGTCGTHAVEQCGGIKAKEDVRQFMLRQARNTRTFIPQLPTDFTEQQRNTLMGIASTYRLWDAQIEELSSRKTKVHLGHFCGSGAFEVVAAVGDRSRTARFYSWESLREALPELEEYPDIPKPEPWQFEAYEVAVDCRSRPRRTQSGWYADAITCIKVAERTMTVHYGNNKDVAAHFEVLTEDDWYMQLFRVTRKHQPHHIPSENERT